MGWEPDARRLRFNASGQLANSRLARCAGRARCRGGAALPSPLSSASDTRGGLQRGWERGWQLPPSQRGLRRGARHGKGGFVGISVPSVPLLPERPLSPPSARMSDLCFCRDASPLSPSICQGSCPLLLQGTLSPLSPPRLQSPQPPVNSSVGTPCPHFFRDSCAPVFKAPRSLLPAGIPVPVLC